MKLRPAIPRRDEATVGAIYKSKDVFVYRFSAIYYVTGENYRITLERHLKFYLGILPKHIAFIHHRPASRVAELRDSHDS